MTSQRIARKSTVDSAIEELASPACSQPAPGDSPGNSPVIELQRRLANWAQVSNAAKAFEAEGKSAGNADVRQEAKLPVAARIVVIVGISLALWASIIAAFTTSYILFGTF